MSERNAVELSRNSTGLNHPAALIQQNFLPPKGMRINGFDGAQPPRGTNPTKFSSPIYLTTPSGYEGLVKAAIRRFQAHYQPVDPRYFQLVWLGMFLLYGILQLGWHRDAWHLLALWSSTLITQLLFCRR